MTLHMKNIIKLDIPGTVYPIWLGLNMIRQLPGTPPHRLHSAARLSTSCRGHAKRWEAVGTALLKWLSPNMRPHVILKPFQVLVIQWS